MTEEQDYELHRRGDHPDRNSKYWLEVLDCLDSDQCCFPTYPLLLLPGDRYAQMLSLLVFFLLIVTVANRSLEDLDAYYRTNPSLIVTGDPDAICRKRPQKYIEREDEEFERTAVGKGAMPVEVAEHVEWTEAERQR